MQSPRRLLWLSLAAACLASCTLDFGSFSYPDKIQPTSSSSTAGGSDGGGGGDIFTTSVTATSASAGGSGGGGAGTGGNSTGGGGAGTGGGCDSPADCPQGADCEAATCDGNLCGLADKPQGDMCTEGGGNICDGQGNCYSCQSELTPAAGAQQCPAGCTSCKDTDNDFMFDECEVDCGTTNCAALNCPSGFSCSVTCNAGDCSNIAVNCPNGEDCSVSCNGHQGITAACAGAIINCGSSNTCNLTCTDEGCNNSTNIVCGSGLCRGTCDANATGTLNCGNSCWCDNGLCIAQ